MIFRSISNGILTNDALPKTVMFGLVQSMIRVALLAFISCNIHCLKVCFSLMSYIITSYNIVICYFVIFLQSLRM